MDTSLLLNEVKQISKKFDEIHRSTGSYFNIFSIAHIETNEVAICRVIKELIDPKGVHYQGALYLKLFMENALGIDGFDINELEEATVEREKTISGGRRIDLYIQIPGKMSIPIEVKINADDRPLQCYSYFAHAYNSKLYYLSLDGHMPADHSLGTLNPKNVVAVSFSKEIIKWLEECLKTPETVRISPIREIIVQFIDILRRITNQTEDKMEKEVLNLILHSKENYKCAEIISSTLDIAEQKIYDSFFMALDKAIMEKYSDRMLPLPVNEDEEDIEYDKYGICYPIKELPDGKILHLDTICEDTLKAGFTVYSKKDEMMPCNKYLQSDIITGTWQYAEYWIVLEELGYDYEERPNFKHHNDAFYSLLDQAGINAFVEKSMKTIDKLMDSLLL